MLPIRAIYVITILTLQYLKLTHKKNRKEGATVGRGYVFEISDNIKLYPLGSMNADTLNSFESELTSECEYFSDENDSNNIKILINEFINILSSAGIEILEPTDDNTQNCRYFRVSVHAKKNYFQNRFDMLRENITNLTLKDFATNPGKCYKLSSLINDKYSDAVMLNGSFYTLDSFIRNADPFTFYCLNINKVVYMH